MTLDEIVDLVAASERTQWHKIHVATVSGWEYGRTPGDESLRPVMHDVLAIYKADIDISVALGRTVQSPFYEPWVENFPNTDASLIAAWIRYRGNLVHEWFGVIVDGARYLLPIPTPGKSGFVISRSELPLATCMFNLYGSGGVHGSLDEALQRAQINVVG